MLSTSVWIHSRCGGHAHAALIATYTCTGVAARGNTLTSLMSH